MTKIRIYGAGNKLEKKISAPDNVRVIQCSWNERGEVDEISFQFDGSGMDLVDLENEHPRRVGFTVPESHDEVEDEEDEVDVED